MAGAVLGPQFEADLQCPTMNFGESPFRTREPYDPSRSSRASSNPGTSLGNANTSSGDTKSTKTKGRASDVISAFLNLFQNHEKKSTCNKTADSIKTKANRSDFVFSVQSSDLSSAGKSQKGLSKSWSHFIHDPFGELKDGDEDNIFYNESYFEDDYLQDYRDHVFDGELGGARSPAVPGIRMGVSSLRWKAHNVADEEFEGSFAAFSRNSASRKASRKKHFSTSDISSVSKFTTMCSEETQTEESFLETPLESLIACDPHLGLNIAFDSTLDDSHVDFFEVNDETADKNSESSFKLFVPESFYTVASNNEASGISHADDQYFSISSAQVTPDNFSESRAPFSISANDENMGLAHGGRIDTYSDCQTSDNNVECFVTDQGDSSGDEVFSKSTPVKTPSKFSLNFLSFPSSSDTDNKAAPSVGHLITSPNIAKTPTHRRSTESGYDSCERSGGSSQPVEDPSSKLPSQTSPETDTPSAPSPNTSHTEVDEFDDIRSPVLDTSINHKTFPDLKNYPLYKSMSEIRESNSDELDQQETSSKPIEKKRGDLAHSISLACNRFETLLTTVEVGPIITKPFTNLGRDSPETSRNPLDFISTESHEFDQKDNVMETSTIPQQPVNPTFSHPRYNCISSPQSKTLAPLSTSSPLLRSKSPTGTNRFASPRFVSPVRRNLSGTPSSLLCPRRMRRRKTRDITGSFRSSPRTSECDASHAFRLTDVSSDEEIEVISPASRDYILLKRAADSIVHTLPPLPDIKAQVNTARLIEYLNLFYMHEVYQIANSAVRSVTDLKHFKHESCAVFRTERLTVENCIPELLLAILVNKPAVVNACRDYVFENLHAVATRCAEFCQAPPEVVVMLLSNTRAIVLGPRGFPLGYRDSEREVLRAVVKYMDFNKSGDMIKDRLLKRMLLSVVDPRVHKALTTGKKLFCDSGRSKLGLGNSVFARPYHGIAYEWTDKFVTASNTRQEYLFQPFLSNAVSSYPSTGHEPEVEQPKIDEVAGVCDESHALRKLYFSYRRHNKVPYITRIGLQYMHKGVTKTCGFGEDLEPVRSGWLDNGLDLNRYIINKFDLEDSTDQFDSTGQGVGDDGQTTRAAGNHKMTAVKLASGEHVTGVALQGDAVLHNVQITTNKGRQIRVHNEDSTACGPWTHIQPPSDATTYCLHALYADVKAPYSRSYLRDIGAVWAVLSRPLNNLGI